MYIGRFAPSPTGPLHFGSLLAAVASFLDARAHKGEWFLRIENIDPPREVESRIHKIPQTLEQFGLCWDGEISYQSDNYERYQETLAKLSTLGLTYACDCSRKALLLRSGANRYDNFCRSKALCDAPSCATRFLANIPYVPWTDRIQGTINASNTEPDDFILQRKDGLWSYQLAVVCDDYAQRVTHVVRGYDLLNETDKHIQLYTALGWSIPSYAHIPIATSAAGQKLSKQNFATPLDTQNANLQLCEALAFLGHTVPVMLRKSSVQHILQWAIEHWNIAHVPALPSRIWPNS